MTSIKDIILGTGNYSNVKSGNTVSITGDGGNAWGYLGPAYKRLAPRLKTYLNYANGYQELLKIDDINEYIRFRKEIEDEYIKSYYKTRLKGLDVYELLDTLYNRFGCNIILLCHEDIDEFCHRGLVADYIELKTGIYIPEVSIEDNKVKRIQPIRYKNRLKNLGDLWLRILYYILI